MVRYGLYNTWNSTMSSIIYDTYEQAEKAMRHHPSVLFIKIVKIIIE